MADKKTGDEAVEEILDRFAPALESIREQEKLVDQLFEDCKKDFEKPR